MLCRPMDSSRTRRVCIRTALAVLLSSASGVSAAGSHVSPPVDIVYRSEGTDCPSRDEFVAAVQDALTDSEVQLPRDERQFTIVLEDGRGTLEVRSEGGGSTRHEVRGSNCSEVGSALALSLALAIAPSPRGEVTAANDSSPGTAPPVPQPPDPSPAKPAIGLAAIGVIGPTPVALGGTLFFDFPHRRRRLIAPHARFGAAYLETLEPQTFTSPAVQSPIPPSAGTVRVRWQWYLARAEVCGLHFATPTDSYGLRLCAAMDAGYIVSDPSVLRNTRGSRNIWAAAGLAVRSFWELSGIRFELGTGLSFPLTRYEYFFDDYAGGARTFSATDAYQIQPVGWTFSFGAAYALP